MAQKNSEGIIPITADTKDVKSLIHVIRGNQVMLDSDLAMLYQVETKVFTHSSQTNRSPQTLKIQLFI